MSDLTVTALGVVSSVGTRVVDTCASIRAGINRARPVTHFSVLEGDAHVPMPLEGHPISGLTDGQSPTARWVIMGERAARNLLADLHSTGSSTGQGRWGALLVLPALDDARFFYVPVCRPDVVRAVLWRMLTAEARLPLDERHFELVTVGPAGIGVAIAQARAWLNAGGVANVVVLAVDSLIDAWSLAWLAAERRLSDPSAPVGMAPGEAAVALLLSRAAASGADRTRARVGAVVTASAGHPYSAPERLQGRGMAAALAKARDASGGPITGDVYIDLNGETWRAAELGGALATLGQSGLGVHRMHTTAASVGDTGAASGALAIACASQAFARGYSSGPRSWVISSSDRGQISVACVEGPAHG